MTANHEPSACCPQCIENRMQLLDENIGLRERVAELVNDLEQTRKTLRWAQNDLRQWKLRAERWKDAARMYRGAAWEFNPDWKQMKMIMGWSAYATD